jgi:hypothetical protein
MGMDKNATAQDGTTSTWTQVIGFNVRTGFAGSSIVGNALVPNGSGTFTLYANVNYGYEYGTHQCRVKKNGTVILTSASNNYPSTGSGNSDKNVFVSGSVTLTAGDQLTLEFYTDTTFSGAQHITTGPTTYLYFQ